MQKRALVTGLSAGVLLAFAAFGAGCKKEEQKTEKAETTAPAAAPAATPQPAAAPQTAGGIFGAEISTDKAPESMKAGETVTVPVKVKNTSTEKWVKDKAKPINLSYHWKNASDKKVVTWDGSRTLIAKDVAPGDEIVLTPKVKAPKAGKYVLEFDMVQDTPDGGWFGKKGSKVASYNVEVK